MRTSGLLWDLLGSFDEAFGLNDNVEEVFEFNWKFSSLLWVSTLDTLLTTEDSPASHDSNDHLTTFPIWNVSSKFPIFIVTNSTQNPQTNTESLSRPITGEFQFRIEALRIKNSE